MAIGSDKNASSGGPEVETPKVSSKDLGVAAWTCSLGSALSTMTSRFTVSLRL